LNTSVGGMYLYTCVYGRRFLPNRHSKCQ